MPSVAWVPPYVPDMVDHWVMDEEEFDEEETVGHMPLFTNTWSAGSKIQDPISKVDIAGAGTQRNISGCSLEFWDLGPSVVHSGW